MPMRLVPKDPTASMEEQNIEREISRGRGSENRELMNVDPGDRLSTNPASALIVCP